MVLHNQTPQDLHRVALGLDHGEWTTQPPETIAAWQTVTFKSESDGIGTGTEAWANFRIGQSADQLNLHWANPFTGLNRYAQSVSGPWGVYFSGGKGDQTTVEYYFIDSDRHAIPNYRPSRFGFQFGNHWPSIHITSVDLPGGTSLPIGDASMGMCGGMAFASRDYYDFGNEAPRQTTNPTGEGDPLFDYVVRRLAASLNPGDVANFIKFASPHYPDTDDLTGEGRNWHMARVAFPGIRNVIDSGHPCPIGIITGSLFNPAHLGHQVLVYGYQLQNQLLTLWIYDPNSPSNDNVTMTLDISNTRDHLIGVAHNLNLAGNPPITCFFTQSYETRFPVGWIDGGGPGTHRATGDTMPPHTGILEGEQITSTNGHFHLTHQPGGNITLTWDQGRLWESGSGGNGGGTLIMQADGYLVLYGRDGRAVWATGTDGNNGAHLIMQDDGNAVIYAASGQAVWASNTVTALPWLPDVSIVKPNVLNPEVAATIERLTTKADRSDGSGGGHRFDSI